jgi:hypothetical protein
VVAIAAAALIIGCVLGGVGYRLLAEPTSSDSTVTSPSATSMAPHPPPPRSSPSAAKAKTCSVLEKDYPAVASAVHEEKQYENSSWTDPDLLRSSNQLVETMTKLAGNLERSLSAETPSSLRNAVVEYVAALRAVSISDRNRASNEQLNGTALFYNQVRKAPLKICGLAG